MSERHGAVFAYYIALWGLADKGSLGIRLGGRLGRRLEDRDVGRRAGFRIRMNSVVWMDNLHLPFVEKIPWPFGLFHFFLSGLSAFVVLHFFFSPVLLWVLVLVCCF